MISDVVEIKSKIFFIKIYLKRKEIIKGKCLYECLHKCTAFSYFSKIEKNSQDIGKAKIYKILCLWEKLCTKAL